MSPEERAARLFRGDCGHEAGERSMMVCLEGKPNTLEMDEPDRPGCIEREIAQAIRDAEQAVVRRVLEIADRHPWADFRREMLAAFPEPTAKPEEEA